MGNPNEGVIPRAAGGLKSAKKHLPTTLCACSPQALGVSVMKRMPRVPGPQWLEMVQLAVVV